MVRCMTTQQLSKIFRVCGIRGVQFVDPVIGELACGYEGMGKLAPVEDILAKVSSILSKDA